MCLAMDVCKTNALLQKKKKKKENFKPLKNDKMKTEGKKEKHFKDTLTEILPKHPKGQSKHRKK